MIPKSLKPIPKEKAEKIIAKHLKDGTGCYEYSFGLGDFAYRSGKQLYMIRKTSNNTYERGKVCL